MAKSIIYLLTVLALLSIFAPLTVDASSKCASSFKATDIEQAITTPENPRGNENYTQCLLVVEVTDDKKILVMKFTQVSPMTTSDIVFYLNENVMYKFQKDFLPETNVSYIVPLTKFNIVYSGSKQEMKFSMTYMQVAPAEVAEELGAKDSWESITSKNYPNNYPLNTVKIYRIVANSPEGLLKFKMQECKQTFPVADFVVIYNGSVINSSNIVQSFNCSDSPAEFDVKNYEALVVFKSDIVDQKKKVFKLDYAMYDGTEQETEAPTEPETEPPTKPKTGPPTKLATGPANEPATEPATEPETEAATEPATKSTTGSENKSTIKSSPAQITTTSTSSSIAKATTTTSIMLIFFNVYVYSANVYSSLYM